jgi:hypothetical protein
MLTFQNIYDTIIILTDVKGDDTLSDTTRFSCFHGTDKTAAIEIINSNFLYKKSEEHWLGNGAYFYLDYSLAKWWTSKPSKKFGTKINEPAILKCSIEVNYDEILDLRKLESFEEFAKIYKSDFLPKVFDDTIICHGISGANIKDVKKLRCTYCDYLSKLYELKAIIGTFHLPSQPYLKDDYGDGFNQFDIAYTETQLCVFDQGIIKEKEII